jgi:uncharacterized protein (TIGR02145 family)
MPLNLGGFTTNTAKLPGINFNSPDTNEIKKVIEDTKNKLVKLQSIGLPGIKDIPDTIWQIIVATCLLSPRQISKKLLMNQGSQYATGWFPGSPPITEEQAQFIVYGKIFKKNGKLWDRDYLLTSWVWYKDSSYNDSNIDCVAHPDEEDYSPPLERDHPMFQNAIKMVKDCKDDLKQLGIKVAEFILALPDAIATIIISLVSMVSSLIILPPGAGVPTAITAVKTMLKTLKDLQARVEVFLPLLGALETLSLIIRKECQSIISKIIAIIKIILTILSILDFILGLFNKVVEALAKLIKKNDESAANMQVEPVANDGNLEMGESTKLDAGPSGGNWDYNYQWVDENGNVISTDRKATVSPEKSTNYTVKLTDKATGQIKESKVRVKVRASEENVNDIGTSGTNGISGTTSGINTIEYNTPSGPSVTYTTTQASEGICMGLLYNWWSITGTSTNSISSDDNWTTPTKTDWETLRTQIGGSTKGGTLKETGYLYWNSPNTNATNIHSFNVRGSGIRLNTGQYLDIKNSATLWTTTTFDEGRLYSAYLEYSDGILTIGGAPEKNRGLALRLVRNSTPLASGQTSTYIGNDGKIYNTICLGTQEWLSENLRETKYRNGSNINYVTDANTWMNLTSGAYCAYNNDINYSSSCPSLTTTTTTSP